ncbi:MAG: glycosyltransferase family 39 protein [Bacteroidota bacterium]
MENILSKRIIIFLYLLLALVYVAGLFIPLMESDSAQHATMAMHMYLKNDFIHLFKGFDEYLDKPHMHFWLSALSFKIFGLTHWAYRLPALLFTFIGALSTYKLAKELYGVKAGHIASLIFLSTQAIILANHDVRTDAVLTGASIFAIWQWVRYLNHEKLRYAILGAFGTGIAFSTKGQLAIFFIGSTLLCYVLYSRKWKAVFNWKVLVGIVAFLVTCIPMLYAYYQQFDMFPNKVVEGRTNVSGIKFIFWDQSFNRITGSGFESNNKDYFFFFHTLLWAFLPWAFIAYVAIFDRTKQFIKIKFKYQNGLEFLTVGGFWLIMLIINMSKSKLPHYMNSLLPVLAVLLSGYIVYLFENSKAKMLKILLGIQYFIVIVGSTLAIVLITVVFPLPDTLLILLYIILFLILIYALFKKMETVSKIIIISVLFAVFTNFTLNTQFYPNLLKYQAGSNMTKIIDEEGINIDDVYILDKRYSWSLNFYTQRETPGIATSELENYKGKWLFVYDRDIEKLKSQNIEWKKSYEVPYYRITMLTLKFLNPKTREETLKKAYLLQIN